MLVALLIVVFVNLLIVWGARRLAVQLRRLCPSFYVVSFAESSLWTIVLLGIACGLFLLTPIFYYHSYSDALRQSKGFEAAYDAASFTFPCLAGVLAGAGLVYNRERDFRDDPNAIIYLLSAVVLVFAYCFYLARHPRPLVILCAGLYSLYTGLGALSVRLAHRIVTESEKELLYPSAPPVIDPTNQPHDDFLQRRLRIESLSGFASALMFGLYAIVVAETLGVLTYSASNADLAHMRQYDDEEQCKCCGPGA